MVWDCHSDLLSRLLDERPLFEEKRPDVVEAADLANMRAGGVRAVVWALYTSDARGEHPVVHTLRMIDAAERIAERRAGEVALARTAADVEHAGAAGKIAAVLSIENGIACLDRIELLRTYHRLGVRAMGLVWNGRNAIADGCAEEAAGGRLTSFGREVVAEMERLGMVVDVSHLSKAGFWDVAERARRPFIASHSNVRALCDHRRNLEDDQLRAVARSGGVVGVNFWSPFLCADGKRATLDDVVAHVEAIAERTGIDGVGIGADYHGIEYGPVGLEDSSRYPVLAQALERRGLAEADVRKVFFENFLRVFRAVCG